jgi:hypothetical protein
MLLRLACPVFVVALSACAVYDAPMCQTGADCASGVCLADGTCKPAGASSSSGAGSGGSGGASTGSAGTGASGVCSPASQSVITRQEVPLEAGLHANFRVAENAGVSTAGTMNADGSRTWDLSVAFSGDHDEALDTLPLSAQWFGAAYPGATYAAKLSDTSDLLGVFSLTDDALELVGVASPTSGSGATQLSYDPPVTVLSFPLQEGGKWTTTSNVTGQAEGVPVVYTETYQSSVDAHGTLKTPYATFPVLRVNTLLTRVVGAVVTTTRTDSFVTACFGNVASIVSKTDELAVEFTTAAEVSRLAP